jgi:hypothetical protein
VRPSSDPFRLAVIIQHTTDLCVFFKQNQKQGTDKLHLTMVGVWGSGIMEIKEKTRKLEKFKDCFFVSTILSAGDMLRMLE